MSEPLLIGPEPVAPERELWTSSRTRPRSTPRKTRLPPLALRPEEQVGHWQVKGEGGRGGHEGQSQSQA